MFQMMGVFAEFERAMIAERVRAGLARARGEGKRLGRPPIARTRSVSGVDDEEGNAAKDSVRANCNDKKIRSLNVSYKSFGGYLGPDEFDLLVLWPSGRAWEAHFKIIVR
jgi:DNA invertase Pin-like site-specific DNA recombinase